LEEFEAAGSQTGALIVDENIHVGSIAKRSSLTEDRYSEGLIPKIVLHLETSSDTSWLTSSWTYVAWIAETWSELHVLSNRVIARVANVHVVSSIAARGSITCAWSIGYYN
jgi:hypothetical protein